MKRKRLDINHKPLRIMPSLVTDIPTRQLYDPVTGLYEISYEATPLVVRLNAIVQDPDLIIQNGSLNAGLSEISYYLNVEGNRKLLVNGSDGVTIVTNTETSKTQEAGKITIAKNIVPVGKATKLELEAKYLDVRTRQIYPIKAELRLFCSRMVGHQSLQLDGGGSGKYDPFKYDSVTNNQPDKLVIKATHKIGSVTTEPDAAKLKFVWKKRRSDGSYTDIGTSVLDYDCELSGVSNETLTLDRTMMGEGCSIYCYALYDEEGNVASKSVVATTPYSVISQSRILPSYDTKLTGMPNRIPSDVAYVNPVIEVTTTNGTVSNPEDIFIFKWYACTNKHTSEENLSEVAHGKTAEIPTKYIVDGNGMLIGWDEFDQCGVKALTDSDGAILTDSDGMILVY